jgi:hypothetical protein
VEYILVLLIGFLPFSKWCTHRSFSNGSSHFLSIVLSNLLQTLENWLA